MSIQVQCIQCGATHRVNDRLAGRRVRCPGCSTAIHIPEAVDDPAGSQDHADGDADEQTGSALAIIPDAEIEMLDEEPVVAGPLNTASITTSTMDDFDDDAMPVRRKREEDELDMTPMVDVTFLLLIFFMVTASFSLQKSIEMPRQQTDAPSTSTTDEDPEELDQVELQVDEFGSFLVLAADWEKETPGKQNLITALKESMTAGSDAMRLAIKVHELAKLQALVDAMDAGTIAGFTEVEVTQVEEFD
tara:strand:- start:83072 stop:83812 length:741 start_codon:yes stop_codon:yes gene_type:complete